MLNGKNLMSSINAILNYFDWTTIISKKLFIFINLLSITVFTMSSSMRS